MELLDLHEDPTLQFQHWLHEAEVQSGQAFPNAMTLATADRQGRPSARVVLLKGFSAEGFVFFTNYESQKGQELAENPQACLCFYWDKLGRQVRIDGKVERISREDSQSYFTTRPRGSQLGAWASPQSQEIPSRAYLEEKVKEAMLRFEGVDPIPVPDYWGGFLLRPERFEFWVAGLNRLHDRFDYSRQASGKWKIRRLAP